MVTVEPIGRYVLGLQVWESVDTQSGKPASIVKKDGIFLANFGDRSSPQFSLDAARSWIESRDREAVADGA